MKTDIVIVGCGVAGLYCALQLPTDKSITIVTKSEAVCSDSFLAQGGICVLRNDGDRDAFFEDTMRAGHYENDPRSVQTMIAHSREVIADLVTYGVRFESENGEFVYTREGAHSTPRILFHEDQTGKEITSCLLNAVREQAHIRLIEEFTVVDLLCLEGECRGVIGHDKHGEYHTIRADYTVLATGGIGGVFEHSTNYEHLTGDAVAMALTHGIALRDMAYVQIHPTTLFTARKGRAFLISESVRGEGAVLLNAKGERFVDELQPRDVVSKAIYAQMAKEGSAHVWLSMAPIPKEEIVSHFPNIYKRCLEAGYDVTKEAIPVVPSQHYFMGGIAIDQDGRTSKPRLYAAGETACNGVHGRNRLASNSLLESLVFAGRAANHIAAVYTPVSPWEAPVADAAQYANYKERYKQAVLRAVTDHDTEEGGALL